MKISTGRGGAGNFIYAPLRDIESENREHVKSAEVASTVCFVSYPHISSVLVPFLHHTLLCISFTYLSSLHMPIFSYNPIYHLSSPPLISFFYFIL